MSVRIASGSELKHERTFINPKNGEVTTIQEYLQKSHSPQIAESTDEETEEAGDGEKEEVE